MSYIENNLAALKAKLPQDLFLFVGGMDAYIAGGSLARIITGHAETVTDVDVFCTNSGVYSDLCRSLAKSYSWNPLAGPDRRAESDTPEMGFGRSIRFMLPCSIPIDVIDMSIAPARGTPCGNITQVLNFFDLNLSMIAWDGKDLLMRPAAMQALYKRRLEVVRDNGTTRHRYQKYHKWLGPSWSYDPDWLT